MILVNSTYCTYRTKNVMRRKKKDAARDKEIKENDKYIYSRQFYLQKLNFFPNSNSNTKFLKSKIRSCLRNNQILAIEKFYRVNLSALLVMVKAQIQKKKKKKRRGS